MELHFDTSWCSTCDRQILSLRYLIPVAHPRPLTPAPSALLYTGPRALIEPCARTAPSSPPHTTRALATLAGHQHQSARPRRHSLRARKRSIQNTSSCSRVFASCVRPSQACRARCQLPHSCITRGAATAPCSSPARKAGRSFRMCVTCIRTTGVTAARSLSGATEMLRRRCPYRGDLP